MPSVVQGMSLFAHSAQDLKELARESGFDADVLLSKLGITRRQLERVVKTSFKCTPEHWLVEERLRAASAMLISESSVKRTAIGLGFKQASHFSRAFKAYYRMSPKQYLARARRQMPLKPPR